MPKQRQDVEINSREDVLELIPHLEGCPEIDEPTERFEIYEHVRPPRTQVDEDGNETVVGRRKVSVARCVECGAHTVRDDGGQLARAHRAWIESNKRKPKEARKHDPQGHAV